MDSLGSNNINPVDFLAMSQINKAKDASSKISGEMTEKEKKEAMDGCRQLESVFINLMLKQMRETTDAMKDLSGSDDLFGEEGQGEDIYNSMFDQTLSENWSTKGELGLSGALFKQLTGEEFKEDTPQDIKKPLIQQKK